MTKMKSWRVLTSDCFFVEAETLEQARLLARKIIETETLSKMGFDIDDIEEEIDCEE